VLVHLAKKGILEKIRSGSKEIDGTANMSVSSFYAVLRKRSDLLPLRGRDAHGITRKPTKICQRHSEADQEINGKRTQ
jgi:hypothetical protein